MRRFLITAIIITSFSATPAIAAYEAEEPSGAEMVTDFVLVRPMMAGTTIIGTGLYVLSLPFSLLGGNTDEAAQKLIIEPGYETFGRCLGCY